MPAIRGFGDDPALGLILETMKDAFVGGRQMSVGLERGLKAHNFGLLFAQRAALAPR